MPYTMHEWRCPSCKRTAESKQAPPKATLIFRAPICKTCRKVMVPTGNKRMHLTFRELL